MPHDPPLAPVTDDQVSVQSATGVDLTLTLAGPGSRSYAFVIDWHVRVLLAGAWLLAAVYVLRLNLAAHSANALLGYLPAALIYFLYHPIVEVAARGRTPGKRMAGVALVDRNGGTPGTAALLIRNIFRLIDCLPALYLVGLVSCILTAHRVRIGDIAAGTLLISVDADAQKSLSRIQTLSEGSQLPLETLELLDQIIERWPILEQPHRMQIARALLSRIAPPDRTAADASAAGTDAAAALAQLSDAALLTRLTGLRDGRSPSPDGSTRV